jgi:N-dimethylarginine dimethylaminohydrolase
MPPPAPSAVGTGFAIDSETSLLLDVLVCPPTYFEWLPVNTAGRRSLASGETLDRDLVQRQHAELVDVLRSAGVTVHTLEPRPEHPYMVYTRDSSQMTPWGPAILQMRKPPRWGEFFWLKEYYEASGAAPWRYVTTGSVEGGDVCVLRPGLLVIGCSGVRTDDQGANQLASWFADEGWECVVVPFDDHFCHLDVLFSMVADGLALSFPGGLPTDFVRLVGDRGIRLVEVSYEEAVAIQANVLALGDDRVVSPSGHAAVNARLRAEGLDVLEPDLSEIVKGGGSAHCTTQPLRRTLAAR